MTTRTAHIPFADPNGQTLADMISAAAADAHLTEQRQRNIGSSIRTLCKVLSLDPAQVPAHPDFLRRLFKKLHPAQSGLTTSRITNIRSDIKFICNRHGSEGGRSYMVPLTVEWQRLWDMEVSEASQYDIRSASRFMRLCSALEIPPEDVDDSMAAKLLEALHQDPLVDTPEDRWKRILYAWNKLVERVPEWPRRKLTIPKSGRCYTIPVEQFPEAFRGEVRSAFDRWSGVDILDDFGPNKPLAPATLKKRLILIRSLASALVLSGYKNIEDVTSLAQLVEIEAAKAILRFFLDRADGNTNSRIHGLAIMLVTLAKYDVGVDEDHLYQLQDLRKRLDPRAVGMGKKNRDRLRPFDDRKNVAQLLRLSQSTVDQVLDDDRGRKPDALKVQKALAVEILLMAPIRLKNLAGLNIERHIQRTRTVDGEVHLVIPGEEVKNGEPLDYTLPTETVELLDLYLNKFRPRLCSPGNPWLFPGKTDHRPKSEHTLSQQISRFVHDGVGLKFHVHLFRHFAAKIYLDAKPGHYEDVRRHLGHRDIKTTINAYAGMETAAASRHFDETILKLRHGTNGEVGRHA